MSSVATSPDQRDVLYQPSALADPDILGRRLAGAGLKAVRVTRETRVHGFTSLVSAEELAKW